MQGFEVECMWCAVIMMSMRVSIEKKKKKRNIEKKKKGLVEPRMH